ncbi:hypothetical protein B0H10DRAFT_2160322 [Mycena sp. CBHHK59/15]|nr:hypothetical protein B0H10DRAFT_2160322 [Mycena sp. CBHHK59/15]
MSLPPATKQTTDKPAAHAVAAPTDVATQSADVERKIRLYGVISALRHSRMPSNEQIAETLRYVTDHSPVDEKRLSPEGKRLVGDVREIIRTAGKIVAEKNKDEVFQRFVWTTRDLDLKRPTEEGKDGGQAEEEKHMEKAKRDAQEAAHHLRTLLSLVLTNSEMRKLLADAATVGRDLLARGAVKAAEGVAPDPQALRRADDPAPQDKFEDTAATKHALTPSNGGTPALPPSASLSSSSSESSEDEDEGEGGSSAPSSPEVAKEKKSKKSSLMARVKNIHGAHKDKLDAGRAWLSDEYFPAERREQWVWRGKKVIIECQKHAEYQASVRWLLGAVGEWAVLARDAGAGVGEGDPTVRSALSLLRTLLERFANNASLEPLFAAARVMAQDAKEDQGLRSWWGEVDGYVRKVLLQAGYIIEPACTSRARELRDSGRAFYEEKYRAHFDALVEAGAGFFKSMGEDPLNKRFGEDWARLTRDLLFDADGNLQFKRTLWEDVRVVILPALIDKVGYIPIPRVEYTDDSLDLVVENLTLSGRNLFPNVVEIEAHNFLRFSPYHASKEKDTAAHEVTFTFAQMQADMRDVAFYFRTKSGIKMKDSGLADVLLGGQGVTATVTLTSSKDTSSVFRVKRVRVKVGSLKFSIRDSKHDLLYKTFKPLATGLVKKQIKKALGDAIRTAFEYADGQLVGVRDRMAEAKAGDEGSRREVVADLFKRNKSQAGSTMSTSTSQSQFKVVANKRDSLLPADGHPAGWVNRTAEKDDLAVQGEGWRSDAFDIVNPKAVKVEGQAVKV